MDEHVNKTLQEKRYHLKGNMYERLLAKEFPRISKLNPKSHPLLSEINPT